MKIFTYSVSTRAMRALVLGLMLSTVFSVFGQTIPAPFTTTPAMPWTPDFTGVVKVECWGGGGGGGGGTAYGTGNSYRIGGGGGGGSYAVRTINVVSGTPYTVTVGAAGAGGGFASISATFGGPGGASSFSGGAVTTTTASGGTGGGGPAPSQFFGIGGVLGGVYGYTVSGTATTAYMQNATVAAPPTGTTATARVGIGGSPASISFLVPQTMGSGYTITNPTVTVGGGGAGQTFTALANPNVDASGSGGATGTSGGTGSQATAAAVTSAGVSVTAANYDAGTDKTTLTLSATNTNVTTSTLIYGAALGLTGSVVFSVAGATVVINGNFTPASLPKTVYYHNSNVTSGAGGAGGGSGGGTGGAAAVNSASVSSAAGSAGTAPGGGGSGGINNTSSTRSGGAGARGEVRITLISLGIELAQFDAKAQQKSTLLTWTTASEKDNAHFSIEQSTNGKDFQTVGKVTGNGTKSSATAYNFEHSTPSVGVNYYRLKQTDYDGTTSFSPVRSVLFGNDKFALKTTLVQNQLTVVANGDEVANLAIFNSAGQQVLNAKVQGEQMIDVSNLPSGMYIVRMASETARFVKQ